ncbi:MAG: FecR domain-containing protein [Candidatus Auribacterota bacterium]|jgi:hypothetical protein|nr:FecR domain-containing protein [Candidatus Auribacterota bacterium]
MKMQTVISKLVAATLIYGLILAPVATVTAQVADQPITQADFAKYLVRALGLEHNLPVGANIRAYFDILEQLNMVPPGGYDPQKVLNKQDMAFIMVRVSGLENKVITKMTGQSLVKKQTAVIKELSGNVQFKRDARSDYVTAQVGDELYTDNYIKTAKGSSAVLQIGRYGAAHIGQSTEIVIEELVTKGTQQKDNVRIYLKQGEILVNVKSEGNPVLFETRTNTTVAGVMGSSYLHSLTKKLESVHCFEGPILTYMIDPTGNPVGDQKQMNARECLFVDPNTPGEPKFDKFDPDQFKDALEQLQKLLALIFKGEPSEPSESAKTDGEPTEQDSQMSTFNARRELSEGSELAFNAAIETLAEQGIPIEDTAGASTAATSPITMVQLTQFINDLLLLPNFDFFNVDVTPIGQ